jgi:hypothetical protein
LNWFDNQLTAIELLVNIASEIGGVARMKWSIRVTHSVNSWSHSSPGEQSSSIRTPYRVNNRMMKNKTKNDQELVSEIISTITFMAKENLLWSDLINQSRHQSLHVSVRFEIQSDRIND